MIQIIIFSYNRALQLDALLESLIAYWQLPKYQIDILYNVSTDEFQEGYNLLMKKMEQYPNITFHKESPSCSFYTFKEYLNWDNIKHLIKYSYLRHPKTNFRHALIDLITKSECREVMFLTDDSIFIRPVCLERDVEEFIHKNPAQNSFVLRLGKGMNNPPSGIDVQEKYIHWSFYDYKFMTNWGFCFSVDGHIYDKESVLKLFKEIIFSNPNSLEGGIAFKARRKKIFSYARCAFSPYLLSYPINMVQNIQNNESLKISCEYLNDNYLKGYILDYPKPRNIMTFQQYPDILYFRKGNEVIEYRVKFELVLGK